MKNNKTFILTLFTFIFCACHKTEDIGTVESNLVSKNWKTDSITIKVINSADQALNLDSIYHPIACEIDNYFAFNNNNRFAMYYGSIKCAYSEPDSSIGYWKLNSVKSLEFNGSEYTIINISSSRLIYNFDTVYSQTRNNINVTVHLTRIYYNSLHFGN